MRKTQLWTSELGTGDGLAIAFSLNGLQTVHKAINGYLDFTIQVLAGSVRVFGSLDGTNFEEQLALTIEPIIAADAPAEQFGAIVAVATTAKFAHFSGDYRALKFEQVGATPAQICLLAAEAE